MCDQCKKLGTNMRKRIHLKNEQKELKKYEDLCIAKKQKKPSLTLRSPQGRERGNNVFFFNLSLWQAQWSRSDVKDD